MKTGGTMQNTESENELQHLRDENARLRAALKQWVSMARSSPRYHEHRPEPRGHHPYDAPLKATLEALGEQKAD